MHRTMECGYQDLDMGLWLLINNRSPCTVCTKHSKPASSSCRDRPEDMSQTGRPGTMVCMQGLNHLLGPSSRHVPSVVVVDRPVKRLLMKRRRVRSASSTSNFLIILLLLYVCLHAISSKEEEGCNIRRPCNGYLHRTILPLLGMDGEFLTCKYRRQWRV